MCVCVCSRARERVAGSRVGDVIIYRCIRVTGGERGRGRGRYLFYLGGIFGLFWDVFKGV